MSFDLYFLERHHRGDDNETSESLESDAVSSRALSVDDLATWHEVVESVRDLLPDAGTVEGANHRKLVDEVTGLQLALQPDGLSLSVPYWYSGSDADDMVEVLRSVVARVEEATGLMAYDPQAEAPFLGAGSSEAPAAFNMVDHRLRPGMEPGQPPTRRSWFRRWFGS